MAKTNLFDDRGRKGRGGKGSSEILKRDGLVGGCLRNIQWDFRQKLFRL